MEDMEYELLIRAVYKCGRRGVPEADADHYRKMEHAGRLYELDQENINNGTMRISTKPVEDLKYEYKQECRKVWSYVSEAISKSIQDYGNKFTEDEISTLKKAIGPAQPLNKDVIDCAIDATSEILAKYEIHAR